jgi:hypothetical protein
VTAIGLIHILSMLYLSGVICFSVSLNENVQPGRIVRETLRRWLKFSAVSVVLALAIHLMSL